MFNDMESKYATKLEVADLITELVKDIDNEKFLEKKLSTKLNSNSNKMI
jgi:hypothetical protein